MMAHPAWQVGFLVGELSNQGIACKGLGPEEPWQQGVSGVRGSSLVGKLWLGNLNEWEVVWRERERDRWSLILAEDLRWRNGFAMVGMRFDFLREVLATYWAC
jgi:hypothetical protein